MTYFVLITGVPNKEESVVSFLDVDSPKAAHSIAVSEFRRQRDIPSNVHVMSRTAFKSEELGEASSFYNKLTAKISKAETDE